MLPTAISNIIHTYIQDMNILFELQKLRRKDRVIESIDDIFTAFVMEKLFSGILITDSVMIDILEKTENKCYGTAAWWVHKKIRLMEEQRLKLWANEPGFPEWMDWDTESAELFPFLRKFESNSRYFQVLATHQEEINRLRTEAFEQWCSQMP